MSVNDNLMRHCLTVGLKLHLMFYFSTIRKKTRHNNALAFQFNSLITLHCTKWDITALVRTILAPKSSSLRHQAVYFIHQQDNKRHTDAAVTESVQTAVAHGAVAAAPTPIASTSLSRQCTTRPRSTREVLPSPSSDS